MQQSENSNQLCFFLWDLSTVAVSDDKKRSFYWCSVSDALAMWLMKGQTCLMPNPFMIFKAILNSLLASLTTTKRWWKGGRRVRAGRCDDGDHCKGDGGGGGSQGGSHEGQRGDDQAQILKLIKMRLPDHHHHQHGTGWIGALWKTVVTVPAKWEGFLVVVLTRRRARLDNDGGNDILCKHCDRTVIIGYNTLSTYIYILSILSKFLMSKHENILAAGLFCGFLRAGRPLPPALWSKWPKHNSFENKPKISYNNKLKFNIIHLG